MNSYQTNDIQVTIAYPPKTKRIIRRFDKYTGVFFKLLVNKLEWDTIRIGVVITIRISCTRTRKKITIIVDVSANIS